MQADACGQWIALLALTAGSFLGIVASTAAANTEEEVDWVVEEEATGTTYTLEGDNSRLSVECVSERFGGGAVVSMVVNGFDPVPRSRTNVIIGERIFHVRHDFVGVGVTDCPECATDFEALWSTLREPGTDEITLKSAEERRYLPSRGGEIALGGCVPDSKRVNP
ncbi:hypothetical protein FP2506_17654 [Fulvimarina pelagi HTCC2506]|uniref:Uncharacterized protein n=1 Tax=Fulvimarina pelagi HTCC2506 TaxID=314231 RepID=Q0FY17_9HYPH|nr:hypothetical protein [Fulvimarina pelagi]EAU39925.1 hypothetical protein FP2506_17654 [Fulvimarina pelagi HTCC2506]